REKAAHGMRLPARSLHEFSQDSSIGPLRQVEHFCRLTAVTGAISLFRGLERFLGRLGLLSLLALDGRNVGALWASAGLPACFRLLGGRRGGSRFFNNCVHVTSFRGNRRGDDMNRSGVPEMQVKSGRIVEES